MGIDKKSKAVEIMTESPVDVVVGPLKDITFRVTKDGKNIAMPKVEQPNKTGRTPDIMKSAPIKWRTLTTEQLKYWDDIAVKHDFRSRWQAFVSSFLKCADANGLEYTMNNDLAYFESKNRHIQQQYFENSKKRHLNYKLDSKRSKNSQKCYNNYPIKNNFDTIRPVLWDIQDVNNALKLTLLYRTDLIVECEYFPEKEGDIEKGYYIRTTRPRQGDELFALFEPGKI